MVYKQCQQKKGIQGLRPSIKIKGLYNITIEGYKYSDLHVVGEELLYVHVTNEWEKICFSHVMVPISIVIQKYFT